MASEPGRNTRELCGAAHEALAARDARLLPWRVADAEQTLRDATEALSAG